MAAEVARSRNRERGGAGVGRVEDSVVVVHTFTVADVLREQPVSPEVLAATGIADLDDVVGGLRAGQVWLVSSPPRGGRSMLSIQLAAALAGAGVPTRYFMGTDTAHEVTSRFLSHTERVSLTRARATATSPEHEWTTWSLDFVPGTEAQRMDEWSGLPVIGKCAVVIDDLDLWQHGAARIADALHLWASSQRRVAVVTVPEYVLSLDDPPRWQEWVRVADVVLHVALDPEGTDTLMLLSHRCGPIARIDVVGHLGQVRFGAIPTSDRTDPPHSAEGEGGV